MSTTWQLKDLRRWSDEHPLQGAKISTENDYPFTWEFPSLTLKLNNFDGSFDDMARGDEVIIHNSQGDEIRFAGIVDNIKRQPKNYYIEVYVLNYGIKLKDEPAAGAWEKDDEDEYTGNLIVSVNGVGIDVALKKALFKQIVDEPSSEIQITGERIFKSDFANSAAFTNAPYCACGMSAPILFFNETDDRYFNFLSEQYLYIPINWPRMAFNVINNEVYLTYVRHIHWSRDYYKKTVWRFKKNRIIQESDEQIEGYEDFPIIVNELQPVSNYPQIMIDLIIDELNNKYPLSDSKYSRREMLQILKYNRIYYFIILDAKSGGTVMDFKKAGFMRYWIGKIDNVLESVYYRYINPKLIDIVRDMAILSNALWWVTREMNTSLPTLHFYPREAVYSTVNIAPWRSKINDIQEKEIYREFSKELSGSVILSEVLKGNIKKYYQEQSGEYIKTKIEFFAREIGDTFGISIMADVKYNDYTIGQAVTFEFPDENTTIVTCMKKNEDYRKWYR